VSITLDEKQRFFREGLEAPESRSLMSEIAAQILGRPVALAISSGDGPGTTATAATATASSPAGGPGAARVTDAGSRAGLRDRLIETAMKEPAVKKVMDMFQGQIVDIQKLT
jgi:hypothetical protein